MSSMVRSTDMQRTLIGRFASLVIDSDTTPTRFMLALAATGWALMLFSPGDTFSRPVYRYMATLANENVWAALWAVHAVGMWWRVFSGGNRPCFALAINILGVVLFGGAAFAILLTMVYPLPAAVVSDFVFALASFWVLIRTSINTGPEWRND